MVPRRRRIPSSSPTTLWTGHSPAFTSPSASKAGACAAPCAQYTLHYGAASMLPFHASSTRSTRMTRSFPSQLSDRIGHGTFHENTDSPATRYAHFMESSGSQYVPALREAWQHMGQEVALGNLPDEGNNFILPPEHATGDQKQLTSLLETAHSSCLVRELNRLPDSQRERRSYHTLDAWSSKWLQTFPGGPIHLHLLKSGVAGACGHVLPAPTACGKAPHRAACHIASGGLRGVPGYGPLRRLPRQRAGEGGCPLLRAPQCHPLQPHRAGHGAGCHLRQRDRQ